MQRHNRKYTVYLEQSVRGPRSIIPEESHPSVPIHANGNCSAGTALSKVLDLKFAHGHSGCNFMMQSPVT